MTGADAADGQGRQASQRQKNTDLIDETVRSWGRMIAVANLPSCVGKACFGGSAERSDGCAGRQAHARIIIDQAADSDEARAGEPFCRDNNMRPEAEPAGETVRLISEKGGDAEILVANPHHLAASDMKPVEQRLLRNCSTYPVPSTSECRVQMSRWRKTHIAIERVARIDGSRSNKLSNAGNVHLRSHTPSRAWRRFVRVFLAIGQMRVLPV